MATSILCKINPKNPGCGGGNGGGKGGEGGGNGGGDGEGHGNEANGGGDGSGGNQVDILDPINGNANDVGNSGGDGGDIQPNNAPSGAMGPDYSASGIAARKAALIAAISKNVPGLQLTPDDLVPIS